ncbi:MAG TPA: M50 family metallopeptidase [Chthoniobacterales bacterium]|nr:M50 family metallopeptidase [Chthoniobacterales bacterium]
MKKSRKKHLSESEELQTTAVHEAGHAVMAVHFGFPLKAVSIDSDGDFAGICKTPQAGEMTTQHPDGDASAAVVSAITLFVAARNRVPKVVITRMGLNILVNALIGVIPGVGEVFAFWFRPVTTSC